MTGLCLCDSGKSFNQCCEPFLKGESFAKTPKQLMRSRYTAYALGGHGEYLINTWFPKTSEGLTVELLSERSMDWIKLEVLNSEQKGEKGSVEFKAYYKDENDSLNILHEKSRFKRIDKRWYYVDGEVETIKE